MNQLFTAYKVMQFYEGTKEIVGKKHNPLIIEMHQACTLQASDDETPWCSSAMNWAVIIAGILLNPQQMNIKLLKNGYEKKDIDAFFERALLVNSGLKLISDIEIKKRANKSQKNVYLGTRSAMARSWAIWAKETKSPKEGDLVVFTRPGSATSGHIAFFKSRTTSFVNCLGGNQDNGINYKNYSRARVITYRTEV